MIKKLNGLFSNDDKIFANEDYNYITFFGEKLWLVIIDLNNVKYSKRYRQGINPSNMASYKMV